MVYLVQHLCASLLKTFLKSNTKIVISTRQVQELTQTHSPLVYIEIAQKIMFYIHLFFLYIIFLDQLVEIKKSSKSI